MAHFPYVRAGATWTGSATVMASEMSQFDTQSFKSLNADDGGTWAPTSVITIGGSGLSVTGPFAAGNVNGLIDVQGGGQVKWEAGSLLTVVAGANASINAGANLAVAGTIEYQAGSVIQLDGTVDVTYGAARTVTHKGCVLLATTYGGQNGNAQASTPTNADVWYDMSYGPGIVTRQLITQANQAFHMAIPGIEQMRGQTLVSVAVVTMGLSNVVPTTYAYFNVYRTTGTSTVSLKSTGAVTDHHSTPTNWLLTDDTTTFTCDQNNTNLDPGGYKYYVVCTLPSSASPGSQMLLHEVIATYSVTSLRK